MVQSAKAALFSAHCLLCRYRKERLLVQSSPKHQAPVHLLKCVQCLLKRYLKQPPDSTLSVLHPPLTVISFLRARLQFMNRANRQMFLCSRDGITKNRIIGVLPAARLQQKRVSKQPSEESTATRLMKY